MNPAHRILITGASGYIGSVLVRSLIAQDVAVRAMLHGRDTIRTHWLNDAELVHGDVTDPASVRKAMEGCRLVFHLAGHVRLRCFDPGLLYRSHVAGTRTVLEHALRMGVERVVLVSTCGIWPHAPGLLMNEEHAPAPMAGDHYNIAKYLSEQVAANYRTRGLDVCIVNLPRVFGPGPERANKGIGQLIRRITMGRPILLPGDLGLHANYAFVDDVVEGLWQVMQRSHPNERYILGGTNVTYGDLVTWAEHHAKRPAYILRVPMVALPVVGALEQLRAFVTRTEARIDTAVLQRITSERMFDCAKARSRLNYHITPFQEALRQTIAYEQGKHHDEQSIPALITS